MLQREIRRALGFQAQRATKKHTKTKGKGRGKMRVGGWRSEERENGVFNIQNLSTADNLLELICNKAWH